MNLDMKLKFNFNKRNRYKNICSIEGCNNSASHGNSGSSAPWEINLVQRLCDWDIISSLKFTVT